MKKAFLFIALAVIAFSAMAQDNSRRTVIVGEVSGKNASVVKYQMLCGLASTTRLNIFDSRQYNKLPQVMRDAIQPDALFTAQVDSIVTRKVTLRTTDRNGKPYTKWESWSYITLQVRDPKTNAVRTTTRLKGAGSHSTSADEAEAAAMLTIANDLNAFIDNYYVVRGEIVSLNEVNGNKAKTVTINLGSAASVYGNMQFYVYNGKEEIGSIQMKEINSSTKSTCKVTKGAESIKNAIEEGTTLTVVSHGLDLINELLTIEKTTSAIVSEPKPDCNKMHTILYTGAVGNSRANAAIDQIMYQELRETERLYALTLEQYNSLSADQRNSLVIDGLLTATLGDCRTEREPGEGYTSYTTKVDWLFLLTDIKTGEILYSDFSTASGLSIDSEAKSIEKAANMVAVKMDYLVDKAYPIYTTITTLDEVKKDKVKTVTIGVGSSSPVYKGMKLQVYVLNTEGEWTSIGELKVKEITGTESASCSVSSGAAEIYKAFEESGVTRVVTKPKSLLGGLLKF